MSYQAAGDSNLSALAASQLDIQKRAVEYAANLQKEMDGTFVIGRDKKAQKSTGVLHIISILEMIKLVITPPVANGTDSTQMANRGAGRNFLTEKGGAEDSVSKLTHDTNFPKMMAGGCRSKRFATIWRDTEILLANVKAEKAGAIIDNPLLKAR